MSNTIISFEKSIERWTGRKIAELRKETIEETRSSLIKKGILIRLFSEFPFIGRGNIMRDKIVSHQEVGQGVAFLARFGFDPKELANRIWNHFQSKLPAPHITLEFMPENDRGAFVGAVESVLASIPATRMPELPSNEKKEAITIREYRKLPNELPLTIPPDWEALTHVDATPDKEYVLRILRAHLSNCEARWSGSESELKKYMNKQQDERAKLLKAAIIVLAAPKEELE